VTLVGSPLVRREDERILRGQGRYLDDIDLPRGVQIAFVRSPFARARIGGIAKPEGALLVLTAADLPPLGPLPDAMSPPGMVEVTQAPHPVLAADEVHYAGQPVAAVVAETRALAEDIAEQVEVDWEPLDAVVDPADSEEVLFRFHKSAGDVDGAFASAAHVVRSHFRIPRMVTAPMEPRGAVAFEQDGALKLWISSQAANRQREWLKRVLGRDDVTVFTPDVGGAFGSKNVMFPEVVATAVAATALGRPVKWTDDRLENFLSGYQGRGFEADIELALAADGRFLGLRAELVADAGAFMYQTGTTPANTASMLMGGCYDIPAIAVDTRGMRTHKVPASPSRGAGRPEAALLTEGIVEDAARQLGLDARDLRRRNFVRAFPYRHALGFEYDSGDYEACLDRALELLGPKPPARAGKLVGLGLGCYVERAGGQHEVARVSVEEGGRIVVSSGSQPLGTGLATTFAQIAADELGVPIDRIELRFGEAGGVGSFASRSTAMGGSAVKLACAELREQGIVEGATVTHRFESPQVFSSGCYGATVEIDRATGALEVLRIVAVDDPGRLINPLLAEGQVYGGTVHGLGECLVEEATWDEWGNPQATSFAGYHLLTAADVPPIVPSFLETPSPWNPLGAKGIGEGGSIGVLPAVCNAVADAVGRRVDPPFTPQKLWAALA
jgi:aerobic carbon-monoxide dehydrogenase large subunit